MKVNIISNQPLLQRIKDRWPKERVGIHLTDLLMPRQAYYKKAFPLPPGDTELLYYIAGQGHEGVLAEAAGYTKQEAIYHEGLGIWYSPDLIVDTPIEIKTRRRKLAKTDKEAESKYSHYIDQLRAYCALQGQSEGHLWVFSLAEPVKGSVSRATAPVLQVVLVQFTAEELKTCLDMLERNKFLLEEALTNCCPNRLEFCPKWCCGSEVYNDDGETVFEPRCAWFFKCFDDSQEVHD